MWVIAALEITAAAAIARLVSLSPPAPSGHHHHMTAMPMLSLEWGATEFGLLVVIFVALGAWMFADNAVSLFVVAAAIVGLVASQPVRMLAAQSHLAAMVALEFVMVVAPILLCAGISRLRLMSDRRSGRGRAWTAATIVLALAYAVFVVVVHLPVAHRTLAETGHVPGWVVAAAAVIGCSYWIAVLGTLGGASRNVRRSALLGSQEVAAFIGLLSIFGAWGAMPHVNPLGLSPAWDQRLGGLFMLVTCAVVAIPGARHLATSTPTQREVDRSVAN